MNYIKSTLGYLMAFFSITLSVATLASDGMVGKSIVRRGNLLISPNISGGRVVRTIHRPGYRVVIHEPVFPGLMKPSPRGFIQIDLIEDAHAPLWIRETIDLDEDQKNDVEMAYNTRTHDADIKSLQPDVSTRFEGIRRKSAITFRIGLTRPEE